MKKLAIIITMTMAFLAVSSCRKPYESTIDLAVDYSDDHGGLVFKNAKLNSCYILVTSNTSWTASIPEEKWCGFIPKDQISLSDNRTYTYNGTGKEYIRFAVNENYSPMDRHVKFTVKSADGKVREFTIHQPGAAEDE